MSVCMCIYIHLLCVSVLFVSFRVISLLFKVPLFSTLRGRMWYGEFVKFVPITCICICAFKYVKSRLVVVYGGVKG